MTTVAAILKHKGYQVTTIEPTATIARVVDVLAEHRIGAVLVIDRADQLLGIVSERDIVRCLAANGARTLEMTAGQLMTRALQVAHPGTTVAEAMAMMTIGRFRHLPVMDHDVLVGLISIGDVVKARIMEQESEVDSLKAYVAGTG
jgi:CBS domain-containing protein